MTTYVVMRENFPRDAWEAVGGQVDAETPERAIKHAVAGESDVFGTYVAIPAEDFAQFMEGRPRTIISAHIETLHPKTAEVRS